MKRGIITIVALAAVALAPAAWAQGTTGTKADKADTKAESKTGAKSTSKDQKFIKDAAAGGMAEVELAKLAEQKASSDAVKQLAQKLGQDHGKANDELKKIAEQKGVAVPSQLDSKHAKLRDKLSKLSGADFDRAYVSEMQRDHKKDISEFQREADKGADPDVKAWAAQTLPTLKEHMSQVQQTQAQVKGAKTSAKTEKAGDAKTGEKKY